MRSKNSQVRPPPWSPQEHDVALKSCHSLSIAHNESKSHCNHLGYLGCLFRTISTTSRHWSFYSVSTISCSWTRSFCSGICWTWGQSTKCKFAINWERHNKIQSNNFCAKIKNNKMSDNCRVQTFKITIFALKQVKTKSLNYCSIISKIKYFHIFFFCISEWKWWWQLVNGWGNVKWAFGWLHK